MREEKITHETPFAVGPEKKRIFIFMASVCAVIAVLITTLGTFEDKDAVYCEKRYHQPSYCPKHGKVKIPPQALRDMIEDEVADHRKWCVELAEQGSIGGGCEIFSSIITPELLARSAADIENASRERDEVHKEVCKRIEKEGVVIPECTR